MFVPSICSTGFSHLYLYCLLRGGTRMISLPASTGYLADVFLVKGILPSLPGVAVETQVLKSNFRGVTRNLFSKCMKQSIRAGQWFGWHRKVEVCSRHKWGLKVYRVKSCCSCCRWFEGCKACRKAADWFWCVGNEEGTSWTWALANQTCSGGWLQSEVEQRHKARFCLGFLSHFSDWEQRTLWSRQGPFVSLFSVWSVGP